MTLSPEEFVKEWCKSVEAGESNAQLAKRIGMKRQQVSYRAGEYRKKGIRLPKRKAGAPKRLDIEALNKLIPK